MEIDIEKVKSIYQEADSNGKSVLENVFGKYVFNDVTERIKTFEDAYRELGEEHPMVLQYKAVSSIPSIACDMLAYSKLCVIVAALNEGWETKFTKCENRFYPWFYLYTNKELSGKSEAWKKEYELLLWGGSAFSGAYCGLAYAGSDYAFSSSDAYFGARLAMKSKELAAYCGKQFIDIWSKYLALK